MIGMRRLFRRKQQKQYELCWSTSYDKVWVLTASGWRCCVLKVNPLEVYVGGDVCHRTLQTQHP